MNKKNTPILLFYLLCIFNCRVLSSKGFPECFVKQSFSHKECGTVEDSNYREALYALKDAIRLSFPSFEKNDFEQPHFFPDASDFVRDGCDHKAFHYEGSLSWETPNIHTCKRVMCKATQIDVPTHIFQEKDDSIFYPPKPIFTKFAGKGMKDFNLSPGVPGYREVINFGEFIGFDIDPKTGKQVATSWGKIHYAKDGTHIVPTRPRE